MISEPVSEAHYFIKKLDVGQSKKTDVHVGECNCVFHMVLRAMSDSFFTYAASTDCRYSADGVFFSEERNDSNLD